MILLFSYSTQDGTAVSTGNIDYDGVSGSLVVFNQGATSGTTRTISIPIIDDSRTESTETFTVTLSETNGGGLVPVNPSTATVNVVDNDGMYSFCPIQHTQKSFNSHKILYYTVLYRTCSENLAKLDDLLKKEPYSLVIVLRLWLKDEPLRSQV